MSGRSNGAARRDNPSRLYILKDHEAVPEPDALAWGKWFEANKRHVARDRIGPIVVSTVFLGLDHNFGSGPPLLFETMVFRGGKGDEMGRYTTWDEAEAGHKAFVAKVRAEIREKIKS